MTRGEWWAGGNQLWQHPLAGTNGSLLCQELTEGRASTAWILIWLKQHLLSCLRMRHSMQKQRACKITKTPTKGSNIKFWGTLVHQYVTGTRLGKITHMGKGIALCEPQILLKHSKVLTSKTTKLFCRLWTTARLSRSSSCSCRVRMLHQCFRAKIRCLIKHYHQKKKWINWGTMILHK